MASSQTTKQKPKNKKNKKTGVATKKTPQTGAKSKANASKKPAPAKKSESTQSPARNASPDLKFPVGWTTRPEHWLFKSEPFKFSWEMLKAKGARGEEWDGVRNYQARNNMRLMQLGDLGLYYHSNEGLDVVGICEVCTLAHPDSTTDDERWECVDLRAVIDMPKPVSLAAVKDNPKLSEMSLVTSMRLSVQPVTADEFKEVCRMGGLTQKAIRQALEKP